MIVKDKTIFKQGVLHSYFITPEEQLAMRKHGIDIDVMDFELWMGSSIEADEFTIAYLIVKYPTLYTEELAFLTTAINKIKAAIYENTNIRSGLSLEEKKRKFEMLMPNRHTYHKSDILIACSEIIGAKLSYVMRPDSAFNWAKHYIDNDGDVDFNTQPHRIQAKILFAE